MTTRALLMALLVLGVGTTAASAQSTAPLRVVVTMKPVHALALQVMDGVAKPELVIDGAASPHTYSLRPSDSRMMNNANVLFRVSETVEPFTARAVRSLPKSVRVVTLEEAPGVKRLARRNDANFEQHDHSHGGGKGHSHSHSKPKGEAMDGHVWLDPGNAKAMVAHIATTLSQAFPQHAAAFKANADKATSRLNQLTAELERELKPAAGKPYVVFHDAYQYLEARFGLTPVGSVTVDPETPPSGKRLNDLRQKVAKLGATCVFSEPNFESRVVQAIIEGSTAKTAALDPEATQIAAGPDAYDTLMRNTARGIRACLVPTS